MSKGMSNDETNSAKKIISAGIIFSTDNGQWWVVPTKPINWILRNIIIPILVLLNGPSKLVRINKPEKLHKP